MMTLTEFLLSCVSEDEALALDFATGLQLGPWQNEWGHDHSAHWTAVEKSVVRKGKRTRSSEVRYGPLNAGAVARGSQSAMIHIARHDPARVLAECEAKRRIIALHESNPYYGLDRDGRRLPREGEPKSWYCDCQTEDGLIAGEEPCETKSLLALPYADRPGWREEWRP